MSHRGIECGEKIMQTRVIYEKKDKIAYVTIDREERLNALDSRTHEELLEIWNDFNADHNLRVAVLTGKGTKSFSVGQDLKELNSRNNGVIKPSSFGSKRASGSPRLTDRFDILKPIIAKVNGYAIGGGFELALACDIIIAADHSSFSLPEARLGLVPGAGGVFRLAKQLPKKIAAGYLMTGRSMSATRALELGLVNQVVPLSELDQCVDEWTRDIIRCAPLSVSSIKEAIIKSDSLSVEEAFKVDYQVDKERIAGHDCIEGVLAFNEKRVPIWKGQLKK